MANRNAAAKPSDEEAAQRRMSSRVARLADDALTILNAGDVGKVRKHLEAIRDTVVETAKDVRTWRKMVWLADDALAALEAKNINKVREYLAAIRGVALCAEEV